ncbi:putative F-box/LRR-repeat protein [Camellia lanceoleosa]|uniref:F-box/LRR-repeat protein n=1 Tax=Camellia lanceoleosa TaxID=1840588 RepID=A0ACC0FF14_9ERIC|nr:putative F-box/LRR-repeat protein [Camellia lanceoleosa]
MSLSNVDRPLRLIQPPASATSTCHSGVASKGNDLKPIDRLTEMPDDILSFILSFLSIRDSVKARILSRRWRYICPFMLNLDFDLHTVLGINYKARYSNGDSDISWEDKSKFVTGVDQFLELYNGQKLLSLRICFCLGNEYAGYVDRWIRFAIIMKTEKLDLEFSASLESQSNKLYDFPCQLLPRGDSSQLKYLCLKSCNLRPTPNLVSRLVSLKSLDLEHVPLNQSCANNILSSCLNLEWLRLKNSILPETLCIHGPSLNLKILIVHECYGVEKFEISSIGLTTFEYIGKVKNFSFLDVPRLEKVHIKFMVAYERGTQYMFNGIANDLPRLQTLSLVLTTDEVLLIPARITRFNSLKQLELFVMISSDFNLLSITLLLNASPLLQKLHLSLHTGRSRGRRIEQQYSKHVHCELKEVEVHGFLGRSNEMELAIYLLKNAVSLERMILSTQKRLYHGGGKWTSSRCPWFEWHRKKLYLEYIQDLLAPEKINIPIVEDPKTGEVTLPGAVVVKI